MPFTTLVGGKHSKGEQACEWTQDYLSARAHRRRMIAEDEWWVATR